MIEVHTVNESKGEYVDPISGSESTFTISVSESTFNLIRSMYESGLLTMQEVEDTTSAREKLINALESIQASLNCNTDQALAVYKYANGQG